MKGIIVLLSFIISPALCGLLSPLDSLRLSRPVVGKDCILSIWALNKLKMLDLVMVRFLARDNFCCWPSQLKKYSLLKKCSKVTPKYYFLLCSLHRDTLGRQTKIKLKFQSLMENFELCTEVSKSSLISDYCYFYFFENSYKLLIYKILKVMQSYSFALYLYFNEFLAPHTFKNSI